MDVFFRAFSAAGFSRDSGPEVEQALCRQTPSDVEKAFPPLSIPINEENGGQG